MHHNFKIYRGYKKAGKLEKVSRGLKLWKIGGFFSMPRWIWRFFCQNSCLYLCNFWSLVYGEKWWNIDEKLLKVRPWLANGLAFCTKTLSVGRDTTIKEMKQLHVKRNSPNIACKLLLSAISENAIEKVDRNSQDFKNALVLKM